MAMAVTMVTLVTMATVVTMVGATTGNYSGENSEEYWTRVKQLITLADNIFIYGLPLIIIGGTVGNVLSMVTLCSKYFRHSPCTVLLLALAVVDTLLLTFNGIYLWLFTTFGYDWKSLVNPSTGFVLACTQNILLTLSPWTVVLITFERFISVMWPFRAGTICSRKRMAVSWCVMALVIVLSLSCAGYFLCCTKNNNDCGDNEDISSFLYNWLAFTFMSAVPFLLIASGNACIIYKTFVAYRARVSSSSSAANAASQARALTTMLVAVCIVFLLTLLPLMILQLIVFHMGYEETALNPGQRYLLGYCLILLVFINSATNFILYFFCGTQFRKAFLKLMCGCTCKQ